MASNATPAHVAKLATTQTRLDTLALIGTFGSDKKPGALVRLASGKITRIKPGDMVGGRKVVSIMQAKVKLAGAGGKKVLRLPKG